MTEATSQTLKTLHRALRDRPLSPDDPAYFDLVAAGVLTTTDPVERMASSAIRPARS